MGEQRKIDLKQNKDLINSSLTLLKVLMLAGIKGDLMNKAEENIYNKRDFISKLK